MNDILCVVCKQRFGSHWQSATTNAVYCPINHPTKWELAQPNTTYIPITKVMIDASAVWQNAPMEYKVDLAKGKETPGAIKLRDDMENARNGVKMSPKRWLFIDFDLTKGIRRSKLATIWNTNNPTYQMTSQAIDDLIVQIDEESK